MREPFDLCVSHFVCQDNPWQPLTQHGVRQDGVVRWIIIIIIIGFIAAKSRGFKNQSKTYCILYHGWNSDYVRELKQLDCRCVFICTNPSYEDTT